RGCNALNHVTAKAERARSLSQPENNIHKGTNDKLRRSPARSETGREVAAESVLVEWAETLLFRIELPSAPDYAQAGHDGDGEIDAENAGNFAAGEHTEDRGERVEFHLLAHDS